LICVRLDGTDLLTGEGKSLYIDLSLDHDVLTCNQLIRRMLDWLEGPEQGLLSPGTKPSRKYPLKVSDNDEVPMVKCDLHLQLKNGVDVFIELENSNGYADANVVKYWYYLKHHKRDERKVVLLQVLKPSTFRGDNYGSRRRIAADVAEYFENEFCFFQYEVVNSWNQKAIKDLQERLRKIAES
jgi:hypothetical protein